MSFKQHGNYLYFHGSKLVYSDDHGETWPYHDGTDIAKDILNTTGKNSFFWEEGAHWNFSQCCFVQCGIDYSLAKDDYVYIYSPTEETPTIRIHHGPN
jgi:hypothetical protein